MEAEPKSGAGLRPFEESTKECVRPGEMSDKLLRWSLEKVFSSSPTTRKKSRAMVSSRKVGRITAFGGAGQRNVCHCWKCELLQEWESERTCDHVLVASESYVVNILL